MALVTVKRVGIILLQFVLTFLIILTFTSNHKPHVLAIFNILVLGELIVVFSNLKMRYWFPSLPVYFTIGAFSMVPDCDFLDQSAYYSIILFILLCSLVIQIIIMFVVSRMEHNPRLESSNLKAIYKDSFEEAKETQTNLLKPSKNYIHAIALQVLLFILLYFEFIHDLTLCFIFLCILFAFASLILKIKLRFLALSIGAFGTLAYIASIFDYFSDLSKYVDFPILAFFEILVISIFYIVRSATRHLKSCKSGNSSDSDALSAPKAAGSN